MTDREWLAGLKAGDEVAVFHASEHSIAVIESRNARGRGGTIIVAGRALDGETGQERTRGQWFLGIGICPLTDKIRASIREAGELRKLQRTVWRGVPAPVRARVCRVLDGEE